MDNNFKSVVAQNIYYLRTQNHMTQFELGEKLNYSDKAISKWERGDSIPDAYVLKKMSELFGVTVDYILSEHTEQERKLESILKKINGAGNVSVFISVEGGGEKVLAMDSKNKLSEESSENSDISKSEESENNVFTIGSRSDGEPYVVKEKTPEIAGVIVVATGAADEKVRLEIYDAVRAVYGIAPHRIKITY